MKINDKKMESSLFIKYLSHLNVRILFFTFLSTNNPVISLWFLELLSLEDSLEVDFCWPEIKVKP